MPTARHESEARRVQPTKSKNALVLLRKDHKLISDMFDEFERKASSGSEETKRRIARKICTELKAHATIEEEIFYPALREAFPEHEDVLDEAEVEHQSAKELIVQIEKGEDHRLFDAKVAVLGEYIKHHVREEHALFVKVGKSRKIDFEELGARLLERKLSLTPAEAN